MPAIAILLMTFSLFLADAIAQQQYLVCFHSETMRHDSSIAALLRHLRDVLTGVPSLSDLQGWALVFVVRSPYLIAAAFMKPSWLLVIVFAVASIVPAVFWFEVLQDQAHDCDRKGVTASFLLLLDLLLAPLLVGPWTLVEWGSRIRQRN